MTTFKYVIVGAGPAGLAASYGLHMHHENKYLLIDSGDNLLTRVQVKDRTHIGGIGGAGLFSDGHLMFYPACYRLWLLDQECLRISYNQLRKIFQDMVNIPAFPFEQSTMNAENQSQKGQSAFHLILEQRTALFASILEIIKPNQLSLGTKLYQIESTADNTYILHCKKNGEDIKFRCRNLILTGGRFFPIVSSTFPVIKHVFKQLDVGVRICGPANDSLFSNETEANSKVILTNNANVEYRTFFWCRNGECVWFEQDGIAAYYGCSDCLATSDSNFGFDACFKSNDAQHYLEKIKDIRPFELSLAELDKMHDIYGDAGIHIARGIESFLANVMKDTNLDRRKFTLKGPTVEAVGNYPLLDEHLKVPGENIWYAGDAVGLFIGIIPAMLSGLFVVNQAKQIVCTSD
ncbi:unnamed protein product [Rotaria magnacalcarata]|uniref:Uncharacterized protein n=1 Tax=Rotaria magnacalcarata TaxID=392030 RepID=A0A816L0W3_9BILA|nr:unnamed protein product [Rotaria magnacalcarata]CAF1668897.1 unnamed protein product [Rotaria magnacalcarata]CAF1926456.1 unnamed protein product [Rotaria magnacalcarata]CAF2263742.1 unnamed protein product [Rotaria magnacalcarata]CAF3820042.1 unnamed protein product [Rotaria magnacalcarata]